MKDLYGFLRLPELLKALADIENLHWIRLLYCYPQYFTDELITTMTNCAKICKYVDIPLQHISDKLLQRMKRHDTRAQIEELLTRLRTKMPDICLRTTFIVGFPTETEEDFQELKAFVREQKFDCAGVFTYSREEGTVAGVMSSQVDESVKEERYDELMALQAESAEENNRAQEGQILEVLIEGFDEDNPEVAFGRSYREAPEIDGKVYVEDAAGVKIGEFVTVEVVQGLTYEVVTRRLAQQ